jgi:hypothetical protein
VLREFEFSTTLATWTADDSPDSITPHADGTATHTWELPQAPGHVFGRLRITLQ